MTVGTHCEWGISKLRLYQIRRQVRFTLQLWSAALQSISRIGCEEVRSKGKRRKGHLKLERILDIRRSFKSCCQNLLLRETIVFGNDEGTELTQGARSL